MSSAFTLNQSDPSETLPFTRNKVRLVDEMKARLKGWFRDNDNEGSVWKLDILFDIDFLLRFSKYEQAEVIKVFAQDYLKALDGVLINNNERGFEGHIKRRTRNIYVLEGNDKGGGETYPHIHWLLYINPKNTKMSEELIHEISEMPVPALTNSLVFRGDREPPSFRELLGKPINVKRLQTPRKSVYGNATYIDMSNVEHVLKYNNKNHGIGDLDSRFELGEITYRH